MASDRLGSYNFSHSYERKRVQWRQMDKFIGWLYTNTYIYTKKDRFAIYTVYETDVWMIGDALLCTYWLVIFLDIKINMTNAIQSEQWNNNFHFIAGINNIWQPLQQSK